MKKIIFTLLLGLLVLNVFSQHTDSLNVSKPSFGKVASIIDIQDLVNEGFNYWQEEFKGHWAGIFIGMNGFTKNDYSLYSAEQSGFLDNDLLRSHALYLNLFQLSKSIQTTRNTIGLVTGLGMDLQSYRLDKNTSIEKTANGMIYPKQLYFESNQKSKLSSVYLNIPVLIEFQIPIRHYANRFYIATGIVGSKRLSSHTKIKYRTDSQKQKLKTPNDYSIPEYKCSATVRMGYRWINIFASTDLLPMFKKDKGPILHPYTVGISLLRF